jgi:biotin operon repressor
MTPEQRRHAIGRMLAEDPSVSQQQLAAELGTSQKTVSRDVEELRRRGVLVMTNPSGRGRPRDSVTKLQVNEGPSPGEELVAKIRVEMAVKNLEPDAREEGLLVQIRQAADEIAELRERIAAEGLTFKPANPGGPPRIHPAAAEIRQSRAVLARLLSLIQLEDTVRNPVKQKAANTRWRAHNLAVAARYQNTGDG